MSRDRNRKNDIARSDEHNSRGIALADRGWLDEAIREFQKAIELDPDSAHARDNLASVLAEKGLFREALAEYLAALRIEPESPTAHHNLACFLAIHGPEMAVSEYREAIRIDPEYPDAHLNLGLSHAEAGRNAEAKEAFQRAIDLAPGDALPRQELGGILLDEGDHRAAIGHLKEAVRLDPASFEAWLDLGVAYAQKGFYAEAERAYARAGELRPEDVLLAYDRAALYALWGKAPQSVEALRKAISLDGEKVRGWLRGDTAFDAVRREPGFEELVHG